MATGSFLTDKRPHKVILGHDEWLGERGKGIGSSDVPAIMGVNKYCSPYQLWLAKTGKAEPVEENFLMRMGHELEPIIAKEWSRQTGKHIIEGTEAEYMYIHPDYDFLRASPDREYLIGDSKRGILECKSTQMDISEDDIPKYWFCQVQHQLGIGQIDEANIAWLQQGRVFGYAEILFDPEFFEFMESKVRDFWLVNVLGGKEPELTTVDDVLAKYKVSSEEAVEAGETTLCAYSELKEVREKIKELEARKDLLEEQLKITMGGAGLLTYAGSTLATWKSGKPVSKFDSAKFKAEQPEMYKQYITEAPASRRFLLK